MNILFLVTDFVSDIEQLPEPDYGDVHDVVTGRRLKENRAQHDD